MENIENKKLFVTLTGEEAYEKAKQAHCTLNEERSKLIKLVDPKKMDYLSKYFSEEKSLDFLIGAVIVYRLAYETTNMDEKQMEEMEKFLGFFILNIIRVAYDLGVEDSTRITN